MISLLGLYAVWQAKGCKAEKVTFWSDFLMSQMLYPNGISQLPGH